MSNTDRKLYDIVVIGGGFAGLSAAMNAAFENKKVLLLEGAPKPGGQGGSTNELRNYFGFPEGVPGPTLAGKGLDHCQKYGVEFLVNKNVIRVIQHEEGPFTVMCNDRTQYQARAIIIACGLSYRSLNVPGEQLYSGNGVGRGFPPINNELWRNKHVVVVGGGNSGAQCCLFLSECDNCQVTFLVRAKTLADGMSATYLPYFAPGKLPQFELCTETSVAEISGDGTRLTNVVVKGPKGKRRIAADHVCVLIGADPHTGFVFPLVSMNDRGFINTDRDLPDGAWPLVARKARHCETSVPGIFAVGDIRTGNPRPRASSAVNEGAQGAASAVEYLTELNAKAQAPLVLAKTG